MTYANRVTRKLRKIKRQYLPSGRQQAVILMYHRVRCEAIDPWEMCVWEENFRRQMEVLHAGFVVHPLSRIQEILQAGPSRKRHVFITFDDGYQDNFTAAVPVLRQMGFNATFFIPSVSMEEGPEFWWEAVDRLFWRQPILPGTIELGSGQYVFCQRLSEKTRMLRGDLEGGWSANTTLPPSARCELYLNLCSWIKEMEPRDQHVIAGQLLSLCDPEARDPEFSRKMSTFQLKDLLAGGFEFGSHTAHHPALGHQRGEIQRREISDGNRSLRAFTGTPVTAFAYPHGDYDDRTPCILKEEGIRIACTVDPGVVTPDSDMLQLPRLFVKNWEPRLFKYHLEETFIRREP